jgi:hypothetical protein
VIDSFVEIDDSVVVAAAAEGIHLVLVDNSVIE